LTGFTMRVMPFLLYLAGVALAAALAAYPLWLALTAAGFGEVPFHKLTFRLLEVCALLGLWPLMRFLGLRSAADWGFGTGELAAGPARRGRIKGLLAGFLAGAFVLLLIVLLLVGAEVRVPRSDFEWHPGLVSRTLISAVVAALVIALIEETWFRGALHRALEVRFSLATGVAVTALLYGLVHFIRPDVQVPAETVGWSSGYMVISGAFGRFADPGIIDSLAALISVGVLLSLVRHRSGRIWECIGLHAGFVFVIRLTRKLTVVNPEAPHGYLVGSFDGIIGVLACAVFLLLTLAYWRWGAGGAAPMR
jgi:membrane protease YdiL (CAAX protease family)